MEIYRSLFGAFIGGFGPNDGRIVDQINAFREPPNGSDGHMPDWMTRPYQPTGFTHFCPSYVSTGWTNDGLQNSKPKTIEERIAELIGVGPKPRFNPAKPMTEQQARLLIIGGLRP